MRKDIKNVAQYEATKQALRILIKTIQVEMLPIMNGWKEISDKMGGTYITWSNYVEGDPVYRHYGANDGMYCLGIPGEYFIYLPQVTKAYKEFYKSMLKLYEDDDTLYTESIFYAIEFFHSDKTKIEIKLVTYVNDLEDEVKMKSHRTVVKDIEDMLKGYESCSNFVYYEGDDDDKVYNKSGDEIPNNYFVGVKANYDFYDVRD